MNLKDILKESKTPIYNAIKSIYSLEEIDFRFEEIAPISEQGIIIGYDLVISFLTTNPNYNQKCSYSLPFDRMFKAIKIDPKYNIISLKIYSH